MIELLYKLLLKFLNVKHTELPVSMSHSIMKYYISVLPCLFISWYLISVLHLAFQDLVNNISMTNPDQPAVLIFFPIRLYKTGTLKLILFPADAALQPCPSWWLF